LRRRLENDEGRIPSYIFVFPLHLMGNLETAARDWRYSEQTHRDVLEA
jgi:hypothetical protein